MTKDKLKTGMILEFMDGRIVMVLLGTQNGDIVSGDTWFPLKYYTNSEMFENKANSASVKRVYQPGSNADFLYGKSLNIRDAEIIWERNFKKEMTLSEICKELGRKIKIIE